MKRRQFLRKTASVAGISFVGCGLGALTGCSQEAHGARRSRLPGRRFR